MHDLISRQATYLALVGKGQASKRYKLGETWELNGEEIREVLDALPSAQPETNCSEIPNNSDTISRQAAIDAICTEGTRLERNGTVAMVEIKQWCVGILEALPSAQPERKTGRWLPDNTDYYRTKFICSACGESEEVPTTGFGYGTMWDYCPMCGAKMERRQNGH